MVNLILHSDAYEFDGETYVYKDDKGVKHRWNKDQNKWDEQEVN